MQGQAGKILHGGHLHQPVHQDVPGRETRGLQMPFSGSYLFKGGVFQNECENKEEEIYFPGKATAIKNVSHPP